MDDLRTQFEREYPELFRALYRYVCYRVPHRQDAEDLVADSFTTALSSLPQYDATHGTLSQWLTGIARHKVLMHWRTRDRAAFLELDERDAATEPITGELNDTLTVERLIADLPPDAKALLAMRYEDELTYEEIAQALGKDPATVRKWFSRLHAKLRLTFSD